MRTILIQTSQLFILFLIAATPASAQLLASNDNEYSGNSSIDKTTSKTSEGLNETIKQLELKYGVSVAYRTGLLNNMTTTDADWKAAPSVEEALTVILKNTDLRYKKNDDHFYIIYPEAPQQQRTVSGTVTNENDEPIAGVSVMVPGTKATAGTNAQGAYKLMLPPGAKELIFRFIGYKEITKPIGRLTIMNVKMMPDNLALDEVVVTAAGIKRNANELGYSVSTVSSEQLAQKNEPDPIRALTGKVAGVNIQGGGGVAGGSTNITIRGNSSLGNNNQPLYVVDGVPFDNSTFSPTGNRNTQGSQSTGSRAFDLDPNNIQSITVLKGAAAAALYGSRAANGAIIITSKASAKRSRKGTEITVNSSYSMEKIAGLPDYQQLYGEGTNFDWRTAVYGSSGSAYSSRATIPHPLARPGYPASDFPEFYEADGVTPAQVPYRSYAGKAQDDFFRTGGVLENAVSINSGSEKGNFTLGVGRTSNDGIVPGNKVGRNSINVGGNVKMDNNWYASGTMNYVMTDQTSPPIGGSGDIMSNLYYLPTSYDLTGLPYENPNTGANVYDRDGLDNPYWSVKHSPSTSNVDRYYGNFVLGFDPTSWLNIQNTIGYNAYTDRRLSVLGKGSSVYANGSMVSDDIYHQELDNTLLLTVTKDISEDYSVRAIFGNNINQRRTDRKVFNGDNIITAGINDISNTSTIILGSLPDNRARLKQRYYAFFTDITLDYKKWASLNLVGRNDISSTLPKENRSYYYGGVNGSFNFTDALQIGGKTLTSGKVRLGYTRVGNEASPYQTQNVFNTNVSAGGLGAPFTNGAVTNVSTLSLSNALTNADLRPEFITEFEAGTELDFWNGRLSLDVTYYNKRSTSQIFTVDSAPSTGYTERIINLGQTSNKGVEIMLNASPFLSQNGLTWDVSANFTKNKNMVDDLGGYPQLVYGNNVHIPGQPYGLIYRTRYARDDEGNILVNPQTAKPIRAETSGPVGDPNPIFLMGISNTFRYKNFTLDVLFDWRQGGDIYAYNVGEAMSRGVTRDTEDRELLYIGPGILGDVNTLQPLLDENGNKIPNNTATTVTDYFFSGGFGPGGVQEGTIFDGTVFRLREISLGYSLPKKLLANTPFGSAFISISARNLWYDAPNFPKYMNYDPEISTSSPNNGGADGGGVPTTRRYGVNLRFSF